MNISQDDAHHKRLPAAHASVLRLFFEEADHAVQFLKADPCAIRLTLKQVLISGIQRSG
jgi:hypothetical protein